MIVNNSPIHTGGYTGATKLTNPDCLPTQIGIALLLDVGTDDTDDDTDEVGHHLEQRQRFNSQSCSRNLDRETCGDRSPARGVEEEP